jgi:hypothetical protein
MFSPVDGTTTINELIVHYEVTFGVSISISVQKDHDGGYKIKNDN